jgi:beta-lactamase regulating signal transducer with metallopeptidase domain
VSAWLGGTFLAVTAAMLLVLALRGLVARLFGAGWAYALWLIPAARLVLPPLGLVSLDLIRSPAGFIPPAGGVTALPPASAGPGQWIPFMLASWAGGAVIFLILQWLGYRAFLRRLAGDARPARPPFYEGIATFVSRVVEGPVALGLVRRLIVVPTDFSRRYSPAERRLAMEHERTHHVRGDLWWNVAALLVLAANWFNPIAWIAFRAFRADQELACDAAVAARASAGERCDYARALVKAATAPGLVAACPMSDVRGLKRRLKMVARHRASPLRSAGGFAAALLIGLAGFAIGGSRAPNAAPAAPRLALRAVAAPAPKPAPVPQARRHAKVSVEAAPEAATPAPQPAEPEAVRLAEADAPPAPETFVAPESALAPQPPVIRVVHATRFVYRSGHVDPARAAQIERAIALAIARSGSGGETIQLADADGALHQTMIFRVHFRKPEGENDQ